MPMLAELLRGPRLDQAKDSSVGGAGSSSETFVCASTTQHISRGLSYSSAAQRGCSREPAIQTLQYAQDDKIRHTLMHANLLLQA